MALAFEVVDRAKFGNRHQTVTKVTLDTDYPSGGWAITANNLGLGQITAVTGVNIQTAGYLARYLVSTGKLFVETVPNDAATGIDEASVGDNALADEVCFITAVGI